MEEATGLSGAYKAYGIAERKLQKSEKADDMWSSGLADASTAWIAGTGLYESKLADDLSFEGGKTLLESQGGEYIEDTEPSTLSPFTWSKKQPGMKYDGKIYNEQQIITLGEASLGSSLWFDDRTKQKLVEHWSGRYGDVGSALIDNTAAVVTEEIVPEDSNRQVTKVTGSYSEQAQDYDAPILTSEEHKAEYVDPNTYKKPVIGNEPGLDRIYNAYWMNEHGYRLMGVDGKTVWQLPLEGWVK